MVSAVDSQRDETDAMRTEGHPWNSNGEHAEVDLNNRDQLKENDDSNLKLDRRGLPLVPQPTGHEDDPLVS